MAIDSNQLTLAQYAEMANDPLVARVVMAMYTFGTVFQDVPIMTTQSLNIRGSRFVDQLPTVNWRKLNETSTTTSGTPQMFAEQVYLWANNIDVDTAVLRDKNQIGDPRGAQVSAYLQSLVYDENDKFFNNNHLTGDSDAYVGIRQRLDDTSTWGTNSACKINGGGVDMTLAAQTAATVGSFTATMDDTLDQLGAPDGDGCVFYMNRFLRRSLNAGIKKMGAGGGFDMTKDAFDRRVQTYRNARILTVGVKADQSTEIITNTETAAGVNGASTFSSFYTVRYGEDYFMPWQQFPPTILDLGVRPEDPTSYRTFIEGSRGLQNTNPRSMARVYNVKVS